MTETTVVKGSREDILEQIYLYLEKQYEYSVTINSPSSRLEQQLDCLQETMIQLTKIAEDDKNLYHDWFMSRWYHGK